MPQIVNFGEFLKTSVTRQVNFNRTKISEKWQNSKILIRRFRYKNDGKKTLKNANIFFKKSEKFVKSKKTREKR